MILLIPGWTHRQTNSNNQNSNLLHIYPSSPASFAAIPAPESFASSVAGAQPKAFLAQRSEAGLEVVGFGQVVDDGQSTTVVNARLTSRVPVELGRVVVVRAHASPERKKSV